MNRINRKVFLINNGNQVAMMNGSKLESFYRLPYNGEEGFLSDLITNNSPEDLHQDDITFILDLAEEEACYLPQPWLTLHIDRILEDDG